MLQHMTGRNYEWLWGWTLVYLMNLPLPFTFGLAFTQPDGLVGMLLGVIVLWTVGMAVCAWPGRLRKAMAFGATFVALCQFVPILHLFVGGVALESWEEFSGHRLSGGGSLSNLGAFAVTLMTGQPLMVLALAIGWLGCWTLKLWPAVK